MLFVDLGGEEEDGLVHVADAGGDDSEGEAGEDVGVVTLTKIFPCQKIILPVLCITWPGSYLRPKPSNGGKGEPEAKMALPSEWV